MGSQPLSARRTRFYERKLGIALDRVLSVGGVDHWFQFRTPDHLHGSFRLYSSGTVSQVIQWDYPDTEHHWYTCKERFPEDFSKEPPYRFIGRHPSAYGTNGVE